MLTEAIYLVLGICIGLIVSFVLVYKRLKELKSYIKKDEEMFDEKSNVKIRCHAGCSDGTSGYLVNAERFGKIELEKDLKGWNAFYEDDWAVIRFRLSVGSVERLLDDSFEATDRHIKTIRKKIERGEIVRIPEGFITSKKINKIIESVSVEVYSKEEDKKIEYLLRGAGTEAVGNTDAGVLMSYFCLPNGRVICSDSIANFSGVHTPDYETIKREEGEEKELNNCIWEMSITKGYKGISRGDFMEILAIKNEDGRKGFHSAFIEREFSEEKIMYIQKEALKKGKKYSLEDIRIVKKAFSAYLEKSRLENKEIGVKGSTEREDESNLYLGKIES